jgi:hypothetical protein
MLLYCGDKSSFLLSDKAFGSIGELLQRLKCEHADAEYLQAFVCMYVARCIDVNPSTSAFEQFLSYQASSTTETLLHFGPVIHRCLMETPDSFSVFQEFIGSGDRDH